MVDAPNVVEMIRNWITGHPEASQEDLQQFLKLVIESYPKQVAEILTLSILADQHLQRQGLQRHRKPHNRFRLTNLIPLNPRQ